MIGDAFFFYKERFLGIARNIPLCTWRERRLDTNPGNNVLVYCGACGDTFARIVFNMDWGWIASRHLCKTCGGHASVIFGFDNFDDYIDHLPRDLLIHELCEVDESNEHTYY